MKTKKRGTDDRSDPFINGCLFASSFRGCGCCIESIVVVDPAAELTPPASCLFLTPPSSSSKMNALGGGLAEEFSGCAYTHRGGGGLCSTRVRSVLFFGFESVVVVIS